MLRRHLIAPHRRRRSPTAPFTIRPTPTPSTLIITQLPFSCTNYKTPLFLASQLLFLIIITLAYTQLLPLCNSLSNLVHHQPTASGLVLSTADHLSLIIQDHTSALNNSHTTAITTNTPTPTAIMRSNSISSISSTSSRAPSAEPEETMQIFVKNLSGDSKSLCNQIGSTTH